MIRIAELENDYENIYDQKIEIVIVIILKTNQVNINRLKLLRYAPTFTK